MITVSDALAVLDVLGMSEEPIWIHGHQTSIDGLFDSGTIMKHQEADKVRFDFEIDDPDTKLPRRVTGSLYAMIFDRITFDH